ncbi:MAG: hypothetical protein NUW12_04050 [Firmicutes bacterium]|jgi:hypothetical protein|nr:hypothetical protein [Bacillota bacterium]MDH7495118.1 hypothetical protein [Bacillota bacterium]
MKRAVCLAVALALVMVAAGVASAENKIGVGYYFHGDDSDLTFAGELNLTGAMSVGLEYVGHEGAAETEIYGKYAFQDIGGASLGAFGGIKLIEGFNASIFKVGVFGEQTIAPRIAVYGRGGMAFESGASSWFEVLGGLKADVMSPFWLAGEALYSSQEGAGGSGYRLLVGVNF